MPRPSGLPRWAILLIAQQVHFVDAAEGGYTQAAVGFKAQLKALGAEA